MFHLLRTLATKPPMVDTTCQNIKTPIKLNRKLGKWTGRKEKEMQILLSNTYILSAKHGFK